METIYILNENPRYMTMCKYSLSSLRKHNPKIPVTIIFVEDNCRDNRGINLAKIKSESKDSFFEFCKEQNIKIDVYKDLDLKEENGYYSAQRVLFKEYKQERILLLDADTIIYDEIDSIFEKYKKVDIAATTNTFGDHHLMKWNEKSIRALNSGVVVWNNGLFSKYGEKVINYTTSLKKRTHPMGDWLYRFSAEAEGREELAFNLFILDNYLDFCYFDKEDVQKENLVGSTKIFHTLTPNWLKFVGSKTKNYIKPKLIIKK